MQLLRQLENLMGELEQLLVLAILLFDRRLLLIGEHLALGIRPVLADRHERGQADGLEPTQRASRQRQLALGQLDASKEGLIVDEERRRPVRGHVVADHKSGACVERKNDSQCLGVPGREIVRTLEGLAGGEHRLVNRLHEVAVRGNSRGDARPPRGAGHAEVRRPLGPDRDCGGRGQRVACRYEQVAARVKCTGRLSHGLPRRRRMCWGMSPLSMVPMVHRAAPAGIGGAADPLREITLSAL